ncbi:serine/threonine-protein kinase [Nocardioides sp.]|uniref:serine/threonine-protein kinase n=1 Tax=Nocardioides sp. TaxID=35761 RepID=UPI002ED0D82F
MSAADERPSEGAVIGPYRVLREIGRGGMGVVYEAADDALDRTVALKIISPDLAADPDFRARFVHEARAQAALDSPHVVHVYAHGEVDGRLYLATQLVPDGDLGAMLRRFGAPPPPVALDLMTQVASGLADAHAAGMVHRDLKPANILLRRRDSSMAAYLADFGIARQLRADDIEDPRTGTVGTPSYMAPELHTGGEAGVATDIYSLGCLLWATLSGHAPYRGGTPDDVISAHTEQPVPQLPGGSPLATEVNRILRTAMAKDPADRYRSAAALRDDLLRARTLSPTPLPTTPRVRRSPLPIAVAVAAAVLVVGAVVLGVTLDEDPPARAVDRPTGSPTPSLPDASDTGPAPVGPSGPLSAADARTAARSLTEALRGQGLLTEEQATCTAEQWIEEAGLEQMVQDGLFDEQLQFVDVPAERMSADTRSAAASATLTCATS